MHKGRMETFSDGVLANIITIIVLEMKGPHHTELSAQQSQPPGIFRIPTTFSF